MSKPITSRLAAINAKCRDCIFDPYAAGSWREQVAACCGAHCPLHPVRPVPRSCKSGKTINAAAITALRSRLEQQDRLNAARR